MTYEPFSDVICYFLETAHELYQAGDSKKTLIQVGGGWMADICEMTEHHIANPNAKRPIQRENADVKRVRPVDNFKWTDDAAFVIRS